VNDTTSAAFEKIRESAKHWKVNVTEHAYDEADQDGISMVDVINTLPGGEVIEDYPDDRRGASCLVLIYIGAERTPVHAVCGYDEETEYAIIVTVYLPDPQRWSSDYRERRRMK